MGDAPPARAAGPRRRGPPALRARAAAVRPRRRLAPPRSARAAGPRRRRRPLR